MTLGSIFSQFRTEDRLIHLTNGHSFEYMVASGALGFDGLGWPWERPLVAAGIIRPELFTVVLKSLTRDPRAGNLRWYKPWECVRLLPDGGSVNKVGLTNPGLLWWTRRVGPKIDYVKYSVVGSIFGNESELVDMARQLNRFNFKALEVNYSCPNSGHALETTKEVIRSVAAVYKVSRHPIIVKVSFDQDYLTIARELFGVAQAVSLNSVKWETVYLDKQSPLRRLEKRVGGGGGGVSGTPAQRFNWMAVADLATDGSLPVIGPSVMRFQDLAAVRALGAQAVSFGAIHLRKPWAPTRIVLQDR